LRVALPDAFCSKTPVLVEGVGGPQRGDLVLGAVEREQHPVDLGVHVAAQVPRHGLEPGEGVDRVPLRRGVVEAGEPQHAVLRRQL
jgi:hypothetical protein